MLSPYENESMVLVFRLFIPVKGHHGTPSHRTSDQPELDVERVSERPRECIAAFSQPSLYGLGFFHSLKGRKDSPWEPDVSSSNERRLDSTYAYAPRVASRNCRMTP